MLRDTDSSDGAHEEKCMACEIRVRDLEEMIKCQLTASLDTCGFHLCAVG